jgi:hypothetical protein
VPAGDEPGDEADPVAARAAESDLAPVTMVIDLSDAAWRSTLGCRRAASPGHHPDADLAGGTPMKWIGVSSRPWSRSAAGEHDLRRIAVLICAGAAVIALMGLPSLSTGRMTGSRAGGDRHRARRRAADMSSTTIMGQPSIKAERPQPRPQPGGLAR